MRVITTLWERLDPDDLDGSFRRVAPAMAVAFTAAQQENAQASPVYLAQFVGLESGAGPADVQRTPRIAGTTHRGKPVPLVLASGVIEVKVALRERVPIAVAMRRGLNRLLRSVATEVTQAGRDALHEAMRAEPTVDSYRRVVHGTCGACMAQQSVESSVERELDTHPNCRCVTEPVVQPELDEKRVKQWMKQPKGTLTKTLKRTDLHPLDRAEIEAAYNRRYGKVQKALAEPVQRPTGKQLVDNMTDADKQATFGKAKADAIDAGKVDVEDLAKKDAGGNLVERPLKDFVPSPDSPLTHEQIEALMPRRGGWTTTTRKKTLDVLNKTPEGRQLAKTIDSFQSGNARNIPALRTDVAKRLAGEALPEGRVSTIDNLLNAIRHGPTTDKPLYRGMRLEGYVEDLLEKYKPGDDFDLNISSFSTDKKLAQSFAEGGAGQKVRGSITNRVRMEMVGESKRGLPVENMGKSGVFANEKEWVSNGRFKILESFYEKRTGTVVVRIQQMGTL